MADTGTGAFDHIDDQSGEIWKGFGVTSQSTFLFFNDDGTVEEVGFGIANEKVLTERLEWLIAN